MCSLFPVSYLPILLFSTCLPVLLSSVLYSIFFLIGLSVFFYPYAYYLISLLSPFPLLSSSLFVNSSSGPSFRIPDILSSLITVLSFRPSCFYSLSTPPLSQRVCGLVIFPASVSSSSSSWPCTHYHSFPPALSLKPPLHRSSS